MNSHLVFVCAIVVTALLFDFINGFHDAANSIATLVSTRVLSPFAAVIWAAVFNFLAFAIFEPKVAGTIGKGIVDPAAVDMAVITGALAGAIVWNLLTWWWGLPSSSSHALVGGLMGAGFSKGGLAALGWSKIGVVAAFIVVSPLIGFLAASGMVVATSWLLRNVSPGKVDRGLRPLRYISAGAFSISHGANDAQKTMGIIVVLLYTQGYLGSHFPVGRETPLWIILSCHAAMGLGTLSGGWRIVKTMGMRLTRLRTHGAFSAEVGGATAVFLATALGIPVSTTHTITGAIVGAGAVSNHGSVRWGIAGKILWAWIFTIPASATVASIAYFVARACGA
jgi:PiT family inorganic phosphate transporter